MSRSDALVLAWCALHPGRAERLIEQWGGAGRVVSAIRRGLVEVSPHAREAAGVDAAERWAEVQRLGHVVLTPDGADYPGPLRSLPGRPELLFATGPIPAGQAVAVVGTRRCSARGRNLAVAYGTAIASAGWTVVSGLARGIDAAAHRGALDAGGRCVGVLGCGLDVIYPPEHGGLMAKVARAGALVSEYPPGTPPEGWRFPPRNRIVSGMADAVVVVEAGIKGGALITAGTALDQGRPVFVPPGDVGKESTEGTNRLLRDGAHPVFEPDDLVEELSLVLGPPDRRGATASAGEGPGGAAPLGGLAADPGGTSLADIVDRSGRPVGEVLAEVSRLEAAGRVRRDGELVVPVASGPGRLES